MFWDSGEAGYLLVLPPRSLILYLVLSNQYRHYCLQWAVFQVLVCGASLFCTTIATQTLPPRSSTLHIVLSNQYQHFVSMSHTFMSWCASASLFFTTIATQTLPLPSLALQGSSSQWPLTLLFTMIHTFQVLVCSAYLLLVPPSPPKHSSFRLYPCA